MPVRDGRHLFLLTLLMNKKFFSAIGLAGLLYAPLNLADQVLVTIGQAGQVTDTQLESAMRAAPFATQFPAMNEQDQAYLRGDLLLRLAQSEALYQEALRLKIPQQNKFVKDVNQFMASLAAERYLTNLRQQIQISDAIQQKINAQFENDFDAIAAAESAYRAQQFKQLKAEKISALMAESGVKTYFERLNKNPNSETVLAEGNGLRILYGHLALNEAEDKNPQVVIDKTLEWIHLMLMAKAAMDQGLVNPAMVDEYQHHLAVTWLLEQKQQEWIPNETVLVDYFQRHPELGQIPERRQIGQLVVATEAEAKQLRERILKGESLFELAGQFSIDPYGRQRSGDMGWLPEGSAMPEIEQVLKKLPDQQVSPAIQTAKGWHLVMIVNRKSSEKKSYSEVKDRVRQQFIAFKMADYLKQVNERFPITWKIDLHSQQRELN